MSQSSTSALLDYLASAKAQGASDLFLVELLERNGWHRREIYEAFGALYGRLTGFETPRRGSAFADSARDAFLYMLSFGSLAVWTIGLTSLILALIDAFFADRVLNPTYRDVPDSLSASMASLIVGFPILHAHHAPHRR